MKRIILVIATTLMATLPLAAQDLIVPKSGSPITAYNVDASGTFIYYNASADASGQLLRIAKDSVLMVRKADGTVMDLGTTTAPAIAQAPAPTKPASNYPEIAEEDIHGSLIAKGNKVFIPTNSSNDAERAGQEYIKEKVQNWGYWVVVDKPEQAHFVLQYIVESRGVDRAYLLIRLREYYNRITSIEPSYNRKNIGGHVVGHHPTNDSDINSNINCANIFFAHLKGMLSDPDYKEHTNKNNRFTYNQFMKNEKCLDADLIRQGKTSVIPDGYYVE